MNQFPKAYNYLVSLVRFPILVSFTSFVAHFVDHAFPKTNQISPEVRGQSEYYLSCTTQFWLQSPERDPGSHNLNLIQSRFSPFLTVQIHTKAI